MAGIAQLEPGAVFAGDFRVVRKLNEGGMGAVYTVEQISTGRQRALKLMHPELVHNSQLRAKFEQEARIGAKIESEHVVEVVAAGYDQETHSPYLVMELLTGEDLAAAIKRRGAMSAGEVALVFEPLCHAVGAAHAASIVHRDLKPENVFLAQSKRSGAAFTVKVLDFGIAKVLAEARTSNTGAVGSPYWMAPEQTERKAVVTPSADVWALGLIAFYLLTGKLFWKSANEEDGTVTSFLRELVLEPIPDARSRATELGVGDRLPAGFEAWFSRCVDRDPSQRFANATLAHAALAAVLGPKAERHDEGAGLTPPSSAGAGRVTTGPAHVVAISQRSDATGDLGAARTMLHSDPAPSEEEEAAVASSVPAPPNLALYVGIAAVALLGAGGVGYALLGGGASGSSGTPTGSASVAVPPPETKRCPDGMASVPEATVTVGAEDLSGAERPAHVVTLNAFCMDLGEVTVNEYNSCIKESGCAPASKTVEFAGVKSEDHAIWDAFCNTGKPGREAHPQNCVSHEQATAYCRWAGKRLPTEEEWEYAARGTDGRTFPWGNDAPSEKLLNACGKECATKGTLLGQSWPALYDATDAFEGTAPSRAFEAGKSPFGIYDLEGNVSEWTASASCPYPGNNCSSDLRTTRGAAWDEGEEKNVRAAARDKNAPTAKTADIGFRCVK